MAAKSPTSKSTKVTPTEADTGGGTSADSVVDSSPAAPDSSTTAVVAEPAVVAESADPVAPAQQVVYVEAPKPFVAKGNRVFGVLIALLSTVIFAVLFAVATVIVGAIHGSRSINVDFLGTLVFYAPVIMFAVGFVLLVLVVNRAGWAAHVIGSIFVGLVVFFGGTGLTLLLDINQIPSNRVAETFSATLFGASIIVAALLAREVSLWMGFSIAARGRKVKDRNVDARVLYDQEIAAKRAEYEQANARPAAGGAVTESPVVDEEPAP